MSTEKAEDFALGVGCVFYKWKPVLSAPYAKHQIFALECGNIKGQTR